MIPRKSDARQIEELLDGLPASPWIGAARQWWPHFIFHFTDIRYVVSILTDGKLLPRSRSNMATDIASAGVLDNTADTWKEYVRLYFRPRTPMQWNNEGIRPRGGLTSLRAHCPVPVFLLFDSKDILSRATTRFSEGNLAGNGVRVDDDAVFLASIPFEKVYHDSALSDDGKRNIVFHRHAEVMIPQELDLSGLKYIICRSEAETETLRNLLTPQIRSQFDARICEARRANLFFRRWTFVETALLEHQKLVLNFNQSTSSPGPFSARLEVKNLATSHMYKWEDPAYFARNECAISIPQLVEPTPYEVTFALDSAIAYMGRFNPGPLF
ncbi:MAG: DarT ssDNA thymidine ADP-ribosyltransferase family protein [Usitatibacteraceae bacterium]